MRACNGCKECCYMYTVPEMDKRWLEWCRHACEAGCAIHDQARPDICIKFHCYWQKSNWGDDIRPDKCGAIFRRGPDIRTCFGKKRLVLVADLHARYAHLRHPLAEHLDRLYIAGHVVGVNLIAKSYDDAMRFWRFQQRQHPTLTEEMLEATFLNAHAAGFAVEDEFCRNPAASAAERDREHTAGLPTESLGTEDRNESAEGLTETEFLAVLRKLTEKRQRNHQTGGTGGPGDEP